MARILVIDDQDRVLELVRRALPRHRWLGPAHDWVEAERLLSRHKGRLDLVLLDVHFDRPADRLLDDQGRTGLAGADPRALERARREQGLRILARIRRREPDLPVILMTARGDLPLEESASALAADETTYFLDDEDLDRDALVAQIEGVLERRRGALHDGPVWWGRGPAMRRARHLLATLAPGRLPIVIGGPTGTGKSLVARHFVHPRSGRGGRFVAVDLATVPRELMAAHLFGVSRGAYTGAVVDRPGAFEVADGGTLFLDEVGNLSEDAQKMLLAVLQEGTIARVGENRERRVDVKVVAATHEDLPALVREGRFRADLFMRLNPACTVVLPPLRERLAELEELLAFFVRRALEGPYLSDLLAAWRRRHGIGGSAVEVLAADRAPPPRAGVLHVLFPPASMRLLRQHPWPGNLRELAMVLENAMVFTLSGIERLPGSGRPDVIQVLPTRIHALLRSTRPREAALEDEGWRATVRLEPADELRQVAASVERQYMEQLYLALDGSFARMAEVLLGSREHARRVQLRFNQLGLRVRELRHRLEQG